MVAHPETEKLIERIVAELGEHGIYNYALALQDPDSDIDVVRTGGGPFWTAGVGLYLIEDAKRRNSERG